MSMRHVLLSVSWLVLLESGFGLKVGPECTFLSIWIWTLMARTRTRTWTCSSRTWTRHLTNRLKFA